MQNVSSDFLTAIHSSGRQFKSKITVTRTGYQDITYDENTISSIDRKSAVVSDEDFEIGSVIATECDIVLKNVDGSLSNIIFQDAQIKPVISVQLASGQYEDCPLGVFFVDTVDKPDGEIKLTCYDDMIKLEKLYISSLTYPATLLQIAQEIASNAGLSLSNTDFSNNNFSVKDAPSLAGTTLRQALSWVAEAAGCFARIDRQGKIDIAWYSNTDESIDKGNYYTITMSDSNRTPIDGVIIKVSDDDMSGIKQGTCDAPYSIVANPLLVNNQAFAMTAIYNELNGFTYMPYEVSWHGNPALDSGDIITITGKDGITRKTIITNDEITYDGGLKAATKAVGKTDTQQSYSSSGSLTSKVDKVTTDQQEIHNLIADKISAVNASISSLDAKKADISELNSANANISNLQSDNVKIINLLSDNAGIDYLSSQSVLAAYAALANASLGDAQIVNLSAKKINTGELNTSLVTIQSDSGNMLMSDNTIQIKDANRTRVQIGKDASADYNMYVWDTSGNLMFDAAGLHADGIKDKIIRDDMVSDTANINASKIDIDSLFTQINGSTNTIKSSQIYLDTQAQTLKIAFDNLSKTVSDQGTTLSDQGTSISTLNGDITSKVWETDILAATAQAGTNLFSPAAGSINVGSANANQSIADGNFASIGSWYSDGGTLSVANNAATSTGTGKYGWVNVCLGSQLTVGRKYFIYADSEVSSTANLDCIKLDGWNNPAANVLTNVTANTWTPIYGIITASATSVDIHALYDDAACANGKTLSVQNFMAIDMGADSSNPFYSMSADQMLQMVQKKLAKDGYWEGSSALGGVTCTVAADGTNTLNGTMVVDGDPTSTVYINNGNPIAILENVAYTFSTTIVSGTKTGGLQLHLSGDTGSEYILDIDNGACKTTSTLGTQAKSFWTWCSAGTTFLSYTFRVKLEQGSSATPWCQALGGIQTQITTNSTQINQTATALGFNISSNKWTSGGKIDSMQSSINANASAITSKVEKNGVISAINQSAESVEIDASKINLNGYVTVSSLEVPGWTTINGSNITTGTISADRISTENLSVQKVMAESNNNYYLIVDKGPNTNDGYGVFIVDTSYSTSPFMKFWLTTDGSRASILSFKNSFSICADDGKNTTIAKFAPDGISMCGNTYTNTAWPVPSGTIHSIGSASDSHGPFFIINTGSVCYGVYYNVSDEKLKCNIEESLLDCLAEIRQIKHHSFDWKSGDGHVNIGFIANEIEQIDKELVSQIVQPDGTTLRQINTNALIPTITRSIQQLADKNDALNLKVTSLESQITAMQSQLAELLQKS